jgi:CHASE2 domain-containing sensor protein
MPGARRNRVRRHDGEMKYHDLDIWLEHENPALGGYPVRGICPPQGEWPDVSSIDPDSGAILEMRSRVDREDTDKTLLTGFGTALYSALFTAKGRKIGDLFERCRGAFLGSGKEGIRIRLRIEPPKLAALPWELLYYPSQECFLAVSTDTPVLRYIDLPQVVSDLQANLPLRMLVVAPQGSGLDARKEIENLTRGIRGMEKEVTTLVLDENVTYERIRDTLRDEKFHVLHFIGHGEFLNDLPLLVLDDGRGGSESVNHERIGGLFTNHKTMKLVLLNSCKGGQVSTTQPLLGMAAQLVKCGVPAVIAMQYEIGDDQAIGFAREFYGALFKGPNRGRVEMAVTYARNSLLNDFPGDRVIGTPVLFSRTADGLFDLRTGDAIKDLPLTTAQADTTKAVIRTREENRKILENVPERTEEVTNALHQESAEIRRLKLRLYLGKAAIIAALLLSPVVFGLAFVGLFDRLPRAVKMQTYTVWLVDSFFSKSFTDRIALVPMTKRTETRLAHPLVSPEWRGEHAKLVERLSLAGAKVIVFDMFFPASRAFDEEFARAIISARRRGTAVVVGAAEAPGGKPEITPVLATAVSNWGLLCVGETQESADLVPLLVDRPGSNREPIQSLALAAVAAYQGWTVAGLDAETKSILVKAGTGPPQHVGISGLEELGKNQKFCGLLAAGDVAANRIVDVTPSRILEDPKRRLPYEDVIASATPPDVRGKIVVVGVEVPSEDFELRRGFKSESRYGYELHADAMNTLFQPLTIRPLAAFPQFLIIFILSLAGGLIWVWQPDNVLVRRAALVCLFLLCLGAAIWAYGSRRVLLPTVYPLLALLSSYLIVRYFRRLALS